MTLSALDAETVNDQDSAVEKDTELFVGATEVVDVEVELSLVDGSAEDLEADPVAVIVCLVVDAVRVVGAVAEAAITVDTDPGLEVVVEAPPGVQVEDSNGQ